MKNQIAIWLCVLSALFLITTANAQNHEEAILGKWYAEDMDQSVIEVVQVNDGSYEGIINSSARAEFVGKKVIYRFRYDQNDNSYAGTIYSTARDMELDGVIKIEDNRKLKITGKKFFMTKTFYWLRKN